jgi:prepilin-type N-terminal cleavage/methylation domain-containing protein
MKLRKKGFTLAEILLGIIILALGISAILMTYVACFILIDTIKNTNIATNYAQGVIEAIRNTSFPTDANGNDSIRDEIVDMGISHTTSEDITYSCEFAQSPSDSHLYSCSIPISDILPEGVCSAYINSDYNEDSTEDQDLLEITVNITWQQNSREMSTQLNTRWTNR